MNLVRSHFGPGDQRHAERGMSNCETLLADVAAVQAHLILGHTEQLLDTVENVDALNVKKLTQRKNEYVDKTFRP